MLPEMCAVCKVFELYGRVDPNDEWLPGFRCHDGSYLAENRRHAHDAGMSYEPSAGGLHQCHGRFLQSIAPVGPDGNPDRVAGQPRLIDTYDKAPHPIVSCDARNDLGRRSVVVRKQFGGMRRGYLLCVFSAQPTSGRWYQRIHLWFGSYGPTTSPHHLGLGKATPSGRPVAVASPSNRESGMNRLLVCTIKL
jgi:hypothetical protein